MNFFLTKLRNKAMKSNAKNLGLATILTLLTETQVLNMTYLEHW